MLTEAIERIGAQFENLLLHGAQVNDLPDRYLAAGMQLNRLSVEQRGLFGTAAAILVLSRLPRTDRRLEDLNSLIRYVAGRPSIEADLARTDLAKASITTRLHAEGRDTFKTADMLYALACAPAAVSGRDQLVSALLQKVLGARRSAGGWAVELDQRRERDALASAHVLRAISVAGVPVERTDLDQLVTDITSEEESPYVRSFCLYVYSDLVPSDPRLASAWRKLWRSLAPELRGRVEATYDYAIENRHYSVRIPWQLYLAGTAARVMPMSRFFFPDLQRILLDGVADALGPQGFLYPASGKALSTRTNGILLDTLWLLRATLVNSKAMSAMATVANGSVAVLHSRILGILLSVGFLVLLIFAFWGWLRSPDATLAALAPEFIAAIALGIGAYVWGRAHRRE